MSDRLTWCLPSRDRRPSPRPRRPRAGLRVEPLESRLVPSTIDWNQAYQTIDGFGASSAWVVTSLTPARANLLFSPTQGVGLSLLRSHILPDTTASSAELSTMQTAQAMGVTVWSTPWSPPAAWKDNGSISNGGHLLASHYQDYADLLSRYVRNMQARGVTISAVSVANEPDYTATYESSRWTSAEFAAFLPVLADAFARDGVTAQIVLPEESGWRFDLASTIFSNPALKADVGVVAGHNYGGTAAAVPQAQGKGLWETEVSSFDAFDPGMTSALRWAKNVHDFMVVAHASAWHYWWLKSSGNDNQGLLGPNWEVTKRLWAVGNYSKFVRPGWVSVGATDDGGVLVSAFKDPASGQFAVVAVNQGGAVSKTFNLRGFVASAVTPWVTSAGLDLARQGDVAVNGNSFTADLPAQSVTTFVGATALPDGWAAQDVGSPGQAGSSSFDAATGSWAVNGGGSGTANGYDQFHFVARGLSGDGWAAARVTGVQATGPGATAGVMFRESADPGSPFAAVVATPGQGVRFQWRDSAGGPADSVQVPGVQAPVWVLLYRAGDDFFAWYSADASDWVPIEAYPTVVMAPDVLAGLAVTSGDDSRLNASTFDNVTVQEAGGGRDRPPGAAAGAAPAGTSGLPGLLDPAVYGPLVADGRKRGWGADPWRLAL
jgi:glucuronoarabinoxylan endo-1,4-beta-xylanase